jgi:hypothetical protein
MRSFLCLVALLFGCASPAINSSRWQCDDYVKEAYYNGYMNGHRDGKQDKEVEPYGRDQ